MNVTSIIVPLRYFTFYLTMIYFRNAIYLPLFIIKLLFMLNNHCLNEKQYDGFKVHLLQNIFQTVISPSSGKYFFFFIKKPISLQNNLH